MSSSNKYSLQQFIGMASPVYTQEQMDGFMWFANEYNIEYILKNPWLKCSKVAPKTILQKSLAYMPNNSEPTKQLFNFAFGARSTKNERTYMTFHTIANGRDALSMIYNWDGLKLYLYENNLMLEIYNGSKYAFIKPEFQSMIMIYKKMADVYYLPNEFVRYHDLDRNIYERYVFVAHMAQVMEPAIVGNNKLASIPIITTSEPPYDIQTYQSIAAMRQ